MGDFALDTAVEGGDGRYRGILSEDWRIWGPNGGYVAAVALRAAGAATHLTRPASFACQFLSVAEFGAIDIDVDDNFVFGSDNDVNLISPTATISNIEIILYMDDAHDPASLDPVEVALSDSTGLDLLINAAKVLEFTDTDNVLYLLLEDPR